MPERRSLRHQILRSKALLSFVATTLFLGVSVASGSIASASSKQSKSTLVVAELTTFTGSTSSFGTFAEAGCEPAVDLINKAGGVLGHKLTCQPFDTESDAADAVEPTHRMLAEVGTRLLLTFGMGSNVAAAVVPILNAAHIPTFPASGQVLFDRNDYPYFWRDDPIDSALGFAMAIGAAHYGKAERVAGVWADDDSALGAEPGFLKAMKLLKRHLVDNVVLPLGQPSYSSEVVKLLATHPQLIVGETTPTTMATFMTEVKQLNGGKLIPLLGDTVTAEPTWQKAVGGVVGHSALQKLQDYVVPVSRTTSPAWKTFVKALEAPSVVVKTKPLYVSTEYTASYYDNINLTALAALEAKTTNTTVINGYILKVANGTPGATVVNTFAQGKKLISEGKRVRYEGAIGPITFPKYHNDEPPYDVSKLVKGNFKVAFGVTEKVLNKLLTKTA